VAGGIEVSFPISHSPTQHDPVLWKVDRTPEREYVTCGERELRFGMQWSVEFSLGANDHFLTQRTVFHNPGTSSHPWMSWSNAAVPCAPDTQYHFPNGEVLSHASTLTVLESGPRQESDIQEMTGYFWEIKDGNAFGAFTPSLGIGLYHVADEAIAPGMKLWSYGVGKDRSWGGGNYAEIQGGPIRDQATKLELQPQETRWHVEFWIPSDRALNIQALSIPDVKLRAWSDVPLFDWARPEEVKVWQDLVRAHHENGTPPPAPDVDRCRWAPSGMEDLDGAFEWAVAKTRDPETEYWRFYHGTWLAGCGRKREAIAALSATRLGVARALVARLLKTEGDIEGAANALRSIEEPVLQLHPQVVALRDEVLRTLGARTLGEREQWLDRVDALPDERVIERRVQLLIDKGEHQAARRLLLSTPFQKVHQRYVRTALWKQLCAALREPCLPVPPELGEDQLAAFGAYREFA
jgi:hypothetical protein